METLVFVCLGIVWAALLVPPMLRKHREGRPASSVVSFRRQLSTLERATPGTMLHPLPSSHGEPARPVARRPRSSGQRDIIRRRRDVLVGLLASTGFTFLLFVVASGALTFLLFAASASALGAYVYALVQIRRRAEEAAIKVRVLRPQAPGTVIAVRRTVNG